MRHAVAPGNIHPLRTGVSIHDRHTSVKSFADVNGIEGYHILGAKPALQVIETDIRSERSRVTREAKALYESVLPRSHT